ncbi:MAG: hypothetical protein ACTHLT_18820 [Devosia sp.]
MAHTFSIVNGWEIRDREDGSFGVYDVHGLVSGPHCSKTEAIGAALKLPRSMPLKATSRRRVDSLLAQQDTKG